MDQVLKSLLAEIDRAYVLAGQELLERSRLEALGTKIRSELTAVLSNLDDEILSLKFKKLNSGWRNVPKPGFSDIMEAQKDLEIWRILTNEILEHVITSVKTFKNRLDAESLFIESRSKGGGDIHLIIGRKDGNPEKAHAVIDEKTGEIRIEDNQLEPLDLVKKIESIITLPTGKKVRVTREAIEEILE